MTVDRRIIWEDRLSVTNANLAFKSQRLADPYLECILDYKAAQRVHRVRQCRNFHLKEKV